MGAAPPEAELDFDPLIQAQRMSRARGRVRPAGISKATAATTGYEFHGPSIAPPLTAGVPRHADLPCGHRQRRARADQRHEQIPVTLPERIPVAHRKLLKLGNVALTI